MKKTQSITVESLPGLKKEMPLSSPEYRGCFQFARFVSGFSLPRQRIFIENWPLSSVLFRVSCTHIGIFAWLTFFRIPILYNDNTYACPCYGRTYSMYGHLYLSNHGNYFLLSLNIIMPNMMMYVFVWIFSVVQSEKCYKNLR